MISTGALSKKGGVKSVYTVGCSQFCRSAGTVITVKPLYEGSTLFQEFQQRKSWSLQSCPVPLESSA